MPFTASHPAAVLPFFRTGLFPAALVIGSMAPDLPYYVGLARLRPLTHSLGGLVTVDLAMSVVCFALWVWLLAPAAVAVAWPGVRDRLAPGTPAPVGRYLTVRAGALVVLGSLLGGLTHLVWDGFTHAGTWGPENVAWLAQRHGPLAGYRWAQYASGVVGMLVLVVAFVRWWWRSPTRPETWDGAGSVASPRVAAAVRTAIVVAVLIGGLAGAWWGLHEWEGGVRRAAFRAATVGGASGAVVAVGFAVLWRRGVVAGSDANVRSGRARRGGRHG